MAHSDKAYFLKEWLNHLEKTASQLKSSAELLVSVEVKTNRKNTTVAESLADIAAREIGRTSQLVYKQMADQLSALETQRSKVVSQLEKHLVYRIEAYFAKIKTQKENVNKRNQQYERVQEKKKTLRTLSSRTKREETAIAKAKSALTEETNRLRDVDNALNEAVVAFEKERMKDYREALLRYVESQLFFHAKALEELTASYQTLQALDIDQDGQDVMKRLRESSGLLKDDEY